MFIKSDKLNNVLESSGLKNTLPHRIEMRVLYTIVYLKNFVFYLPKFIFSKK